MSVLIFVNGTRRTDLEEKVTIPTIGLGVTVYHWSDRSAGTITKISKSGKTIWFRQDTATRTDKNGMSDTQSYSYQPNPEGREYRATLRKDGTWRCSGGKQHVGLGYRRAYHDYSF